MGQFDMLCLPPGYICYEQTAGSDVVGLLMQYLIVDHFDVLDAINKHMIAVSRPHPILQPAVDSLTKAKAVAELGSS